jgi:hypothetical protein
LSGKGPGAAKRVGFSVQSSDHLPPSTLVLVSSASLR